MSKGKQSTNISLKGKIKVDHCTLLIQRNLIFYRGKSDPIIKFHKLKSTSTKIQSIFSVCPSESTHRWWRLRNLRVKISFSPYGFFVEKIPTVLPYSSSLFIFLPSRGFYRLSRRYVSMGRHRVRAFIIDQENVVCDAVSERCFRNSK